VFKGGMGDAYVARLHPTGATLDYCGYIGGTDYEAAFDIAVDASGNAYLGGSVWFQSSRFPAVTGPDLTYNGGASDAFVAKVAFTDLQGSGAPRPGGAVALHLEASDSPGLAVQFGSSFGTGPIPIDTRVLGLSPDALFSLSVTGLWPWIFTGYSGRVDPSGKALAVIRIPSIPGLVGVLIHSAGVTLDPGAPSGVKAISNTLSFLISP